MKVQQEKSKKEAEKRVKSFQVQHNLQITNFTSHYIGLEVLKWGNAKEIEVKSPAVGGTIYADKDIFHALL